MGCETFPDRACPVALPRRTQGQSAHLLMSGTNRKRVCIRDRLFVA